MGRSASHVRWRGGGARIRVACLMMWPIMWPHFSYGELSDPAPHLVGLSPKALGGLAAIITSVVDASNVAAALVAILITIDLLEGECIIARLGAKDILPRRIRA